MSMTFYIFIYFVYVSYVGSFTFLCCFYCREVTWKRLLCPRTLMLSLLVSQSQSGIFFLTILTIDSLYMFHLIARTIVFCQCHTLLVVDYPTRCRLMYTSYFLLAKILKVQWSVWCFSFWLDDSLMINCSILF